MEEERLSETPTDLRSITDGVPQKMLHLNIHVPQKKTSFDYLKFHVYAKFAAIDSKRF